MVRKQRAVVERLNFEKKIAVIGKIVCHGEDPVILLGRWGSLVPIPLDAQWTPPNVIHNAE